ncbi:MAG: DUF1565 domain-containing protein [Telluria sp.]
MKAFFRSARNLCAGALICTGLVVLLAHAASAAPPASKPAPPGKYNYYVSPDGSNSNPGTENSPFQTIQHAASVALPGTTIHVGKGTYAGGFKTTMSGDANGRITYVSTKKWGAKIVPPVKSSTHTAWDNRGSYVDIIGFDVDGRGSTTGTPWLHGIYNGGSYVSIRNNQVQHIATKTGCGGAGGSGIGVDSYYKGVNSDVIGNSVHDIGTAGCKYTKGIYLNTTGRIQNNVVYAIGGAGIQLWHDANRATISNNTVVRSTSGILVGGGDYYHTKGPNDYTSVHNNIVFDNKFGITEHGWTGKNNTYRNNLVSKNVSADWGLRNGLKHTGTISEAPQFVSYGKGSTLPDLRLQPTSPGIGKGISAQTPPVDINGKARKIASYDVGAFQR